MLLIVLSLSTLSKCLGIYSMVPERSESGEGSLNLGRVWACLSIIPVGSISLADSRSISS